VRSRRRRDAALVRVFGPEVAEVRERSVALLRELAAESLENVPVLRGEPIGHFRERRFVLRRGGRERAHIDAESVELAVEVDRRPNALIDARSVPFDTVVVRGARRRVGPRGVGARRSRGDDAGRSGDEGAELRKRERELRVADATALVAHVIVCIGTRRRVMVRSPSRWPQARPSRHPSLREHDAFPDLPKATRVREKPKPSERRADVRARNVAHRGAAPRRARLGRRASCRARV